jgi:hypothetical protein
VAGTTISYQVVIPQIPPTKSTSMVEIVSGTCSLDPVLPNGTSWVLILDGIVIDNYIGPNYGAGYVVILQENGHNLALGSFTFDYITGRVTFVAPRSSTNQLILKAYRAKVINPDVAGGVQRIAAFGREADTGTSRRYAREDHNHGSMTDPVPVHAGDPNVHHKTLHDHSLAVDGTTVVPQTLIATQTLVAPKKYSGVVGAEVHVSSTSLKYMTDEVTPVQKTVKDVGDAVAAAEHGDQGSSSGARHNYNSVDGTHGSSAHNQGPPQTISVPASGGDGTQNLSSAYGSSMAAASDHQHDIYANTAPGTVQVQSANAGSSSSLSRADHLHNVTTSGSSPATTGTASQTAGSGAAVAFANHKHQADQTGTISTINANDAALTNPTGAQGLAPTDHQHAILTATVTDTGTANYGGAAAYLTRADHVHRTVIVTQNSGTAIGTVVNLNFRNGITASLSGSTANIDAAAATSGNLESRPAPSANAIYFATDVGVQLMSDGTYWYPIGTINPIGQPYWEDFEVDVGLTMDHDVGGGGAVSMINGWQSAISMVSNGLALQYYSLSPRNGGTTMMEATDRYLAMIRVRSGIASGNGQAIAGLADTWPSGGTAGTPLNGAMLVRNSADWVYTVKNAGGLNSQNAGATGTGYYTFYILRISTGIQFYLNNLTNTPAYTVASASCPTTAGQQFILQIKNTTSAINYNLDVDYLGLWAKRQ